MVEPLRIATRTSRLALWQAEYVASRLRENDPECEVELVHISTEGDRDQSEPLHRLGGLGVFTREVQRAVLDGRADLAVHSLKDLPTESVSGLTLAAVPVRASMFDVLVIPESSSKTEVDVSSDDPLAALQTGCHVATGSLRRRAQLRHHRPDLEMCDVRGNIETRLRKLDEGQFDAIVLAEAALNRLDLDHRIFSRLAPPILYPAVSQGALGIECRDNDEQTLQCLAVISDPKTFAAVTAERRLLAALRAGCHAPVGVLSHVDEEKYSLEAVVLSPDGKERISAAATGPIAEAAKLGETVARDLELQGATRLVSTAQQDAES